MRPRASTWIKHLLLLLLTFFTCTVAGHIAPFGYKSLGEGAGPQSFEEFIRIIPLIPYYYGEFIGIAVWSVFSDYQALSYGTTFAGSLLFILIAHEMGHYIACRIYGVDATLPYFIPTPPLIGPAGTLGAFIRIVSPMPSRRAVFDIGVAGPIAGFVALIPVAVLMIMTLETAPLQAPTGDGTLVIFSDPIFIRGLAFLRGIDLNQSILPNPFYGATWIGLLVTALNLIPSGQLDGGHAIFAVFGKKVHFWTGRIAFAVMALLSVLGMYVYNSPSGFLFAVILAIMMRIRHPEPLDSAPLDKKRIAVAILTLVIFALCFVPFPIRLA